MTATGVECLVFIEQYFQSLFSESFPFGKRIVFNSFWTHIDGFTKDNWLVWFELH